MRKLKLSLSIFLFFYCLCSINKPLIKERITSIKNKIITSREIISEDYLGYLEINKYNIKQPIKMGTSLEVLDNNYIGMYKTSAGLDDNKGNIVLAGHNIRTVFNCLHKIDNNDEVIIKTNQKEYIFRVINKQIISYNDFSYFIQENNNKILTLITCTNDKKKRLIVQARSIDY